MCFNVCLSVGLFVCLLFVQICSTLVPNLTSLLYDISPVFLTDFLFIRISKMCDVYTLCLCDIDRMCLCDIDSLCLCVYVTDEGRRGAATELAGRQHQGHLPGVHHLQPQRQPLRLGDSCTGVPHYWDYSAESRGQGRSRS